MFRGFFYFRTMKKLLLIFALASGLAASAQEQFGRELFIYDIGTPLLQGADPISQDGRFSWSHFFTAYRDVAIGQSNNSVAIGLGMGWTQVNSNLNGSVNPPNTEGAGETVWRLLDDGEDPTRNRTAFRRVYVPIEFRYRGKPNPNGGYFKVHAGVRVGWNYSTINYYKEGTYSVKTFGLSGTNAFHADAVLRIGFGEGAFSFTYSLADLFDGARLADGTELSGQALTIGFSLIAF